MVFFINGIVRKEMYVNEHERLSKVRVMVFNTTFNNISVISWRQVLLLEETTVGTDLPQVTDKLYLVMLYRIHLTWTGLELTTLVVTATDCIGSSKSNYHMVMPTTVHAHDGPCYPKLHLDTNVILRKDIDVNEHERLSKITLGHKL